jgi:hypothetical protein
MLAGCNDSTKTAGTDDGSGTFVSCAGTLVDGKCIITPEVVTSACEKGTLIDGKCIVTPVAISVCETGKLVDGKCIVSPAVTLVCQTGTLEDDKCVVKPSVITGACKKGTLVGTECVVKPEATFACVTGTLEVDKCVVKPSITTGACEKGTPVSTECVIKPQVTFVCGAGALEVDKCVIRPVPITHCDKGTLDGDVCVIKPVTRCDRGTLVDGECVEIKIPSVTDPVNLDDGMKALTWNGRSATITTADSVSTLRTYQLTTTQDQRKANKGKQLTIEERADAPTIRTGSQMFDGLFAMAMQEARELTVTSIKDGAYNNGNPVPCGGTIGCYQSGDEWTYVWTRDTAYAVDLGLAQINPQVAKNSLLFKLSKRRNASGTLGEDTTEIVQDTGSGGSWPVSTDRVVWARAAFELLKYLDGADRTQFLKEAYTAIGNTIENDRIAAYDARDGLYRGETSFLDWREQIYPEWTKDAVVHLAMSKTLSTNVNHWKILDVAAKMAAELNQTANAAKYGQWASTLKTSIKTGLWRSDSGLFSMMKTTELDQAPVRRYELLGEALAIQDGIADKGQTTSILENYPHTAAGAAVVWPQMRGVKVYHNRAIWPFASSYLIKAAKGRNADVVNRNFDTLISQRTNPACYWGNDKLTFLRADTAVNNIVSGSPAQLKDDHGRKAWSDWGVPGEELTFAFTPTVSGSYHVLLRYGNSFGPVNTGVTAAVKQMEIVGAGQTPIKGVVVMPHLPSWDIWGESTVVPVKLEAGTEYTIKLSDFYNMSYLASNATYNDRGGKEGILNRANITELILRRMAD